MEFEPYRPPVLAKLFHRLPHINITLHNVNSTFLPENPVYLEALGILASLPALWLILTLFLLLIYLCTRCCDRKPRPKNSITLLKWTLSIFTLLCGCALAVGLYGNDDVHNAVLQLAVALEKADELISALRNQTRGIEGMLKLKVHEKLKEVGDVSFQDPVQNVTSRKLLLASLGSITGNMTIALNSCQNISQPLQGINLKLLLHWIHLPEKIRWPATMAVLVVFLIFCIILLFGVARHSRCCLILFSVFGLFAVILNWLLTSVYLASSVAVGDLCVAPEDFLLHESPSTLQAEVLKYYVTCETSRKNPFTQRLRDMQRATDAMSTNLNNVIKIGRELYPNDMKRTQWDMLIKDINQTHNLVAAVAAMLDCLKLRDQYVYIVHSVCDLGLYGLAFMLLSSVAAGLLFTVLVWVDSHTWIYIRKKREYLQVAEQDPFLPASAASQAIAARTLRSQGLYHQPIPPSAPPTSLPNTPSSSSPRYTPLPMRTPSPAPGTFREQLLRDTTHSVYYDPTIAPLYENLNEKIDAIQQDLNELADITGYGYYSSIPVNSDLNGDSRGKNYANRDTEVVGSWRHVSKSKLNNSNGEKEVANSWRRNSKSKIK